MSDIEIDVTDDPVSVNVSNTPGPAGSPAILKGMAAAWPPTATPSAGWVYTLPDPLPSGTPVGYAVGDGAAWDGSAWVNVGQVRGPAGPAGPAGPSGPAGAPGAAGAQGPAGAAGSPGSAATITVGSVTTGAPGTSASVTNSGTSSAAVFDFAIPRGDVGPAGPAGATGASGAPGAAGPAGSAATVAVGTVTTGAAGSSASVTNTGTSSAAVLAFTIPRGDTGATGAAGAAGAAATVTVGTVTTGAAGTSATVTNSGTSSAAVLNFTIPQGAAGAAGATGATGPSGVISVSAPITNSGTSTSAVLGITVGTTASSVCAGNDSRLSDTRTPTAGSVTDASITSGGLSTSSINWAAISAWAPSTAYAKGDLVEYQGIAYRRAVAGTSGTTFNATNWQQFTPTSFVGSQITSGTVPIARLGTGTPTASNFLRGDGTFATPSGGSVATTTTAGTVIVPTTGGLSVDGSGNLSANFATTSSADQVSAALVLSPARFQDFNLGWWSILPTTSSVQSGGSATAYSHLSFLDSGSTANGTSMLWLNSAGSSTALMGIGSTSIDFSKRRAFWCRIQRDQNAAANGIFRVVMGPQVTAAASGGTALASRGISVELRGTSSAIWLVVHNGTTLTEVDSGQTYSSQCDLLVDSDGSGNVKLYRNGTQIASTTSGPTAATASTGSVRYEVTNGGSTARYTFFVSFLRVFLG